MFCCHYVCVCVYLLLYARDVINQGGILHHFLNPHGPLSIMLKMCAGHLRRYKMIETIIYNWVMIILETQKWGALVCVPFDLLVKFLLRAHILPIPCSYYFLCLRK